MFVVEQRFLSVDTPPSRQASRGETEGPLTFSSVAEGLRISMTSSGDGFVEHFSNLKVENRNFLVTTARKRMQPRP